VLLGGGELVVAPHRSAHLERRLLGQRIEGHEPGPELVLRTVRAYAPIASRAPRAWQLPTPLTRPAGPHVAVCIRHLVIEHERASRLEMLVEPPEPLDVVLAIATEPEPAAEHDRRVATREVELVHGLRVEPRRRHALPLGALAAEREHVGGDVAAVDVEPRLKIRHEEPPGAARDVERGLSRLHEALEVVDLGTVEVELGPPPRDEAVVPGLRAGVGHAEAPV
jgi:hypothetical protein